MKRLFAVLLSAIMLATSATAVKEYDLVQIEDEYGTIPEDYDALKEQYESLYAGYVELVRLYNGDEEAEPESEAEYTYILNTKSKKIHHPYCSSVDDIAEDNYEETNKSIEELEQMGYTKCGKKGDWKEKNTPPAPLVRQDGRCANIGGIEHERISKCKDGDAGERSDSN